MAVVAAPQRLGGVERGAVAQRHERVLQLRPAARMRVHVAGRHARHPQPPGQRGQRPVAGAIVARVGALQLHVQPLRAERVEQPPRRGLVVAPVPIPTLGAPGQADQALGVLEHRLQFHRRLAALAPRRPSRVWACASVRIRQRLLQPRASRTSSVR